MNAQAISFAHFARLDARLGQLERRLRVLEETRFERVGQRRSPVADAIVVMAREDDGAWNTAAMFWRLRARYSRLFDGYTRPELAVRMQITRLVAAGALKRVDRGWYQHAAQLTRTA